jgi:hypothetical protein
MKTKKAVKSDSPARLGPRRRLQPGLDKALPHRIDARREAWNNYVPAVSLASAVSARR